jgi:hypothetical protein
MLHENAIVDRLDRIEELEPYDELEIGRLFTAHQKIRNLKVGLARSTQNW